MSFLTATWLIGGVLIRSVTLFRSAPAFACDGAAIVAGSVVAFGVRILLPAEAGVAIVASASVVAAVCLLRAGALTFSRPSRVEVLPWGVALAAATIMSVSNGDLARGLDRFPARTNTADAWDPPYFTSLVATAREGQISSAVYEQGSPLSYSVLSIAAPAAFASATGVPSHVALWGVWMPLYKAVGLVLIGFSIVTISGRAKGRSPSGVAVAIVLFYLLQPLHPIGALTGSSAAFVWGGPGFLGPGFNPPSTAALVWVPLVLMVLFCGSADKPLRLVDSVFFVALLATLPAVKPAMFLSVAVFAGVVGLSRWRRGDSTVMRALAVAAPLSIVMYLWSYRGAFLSLSLDPGWLPEYFAGLAIETGTTAQQIAVGLVVLLACYLIWGGIRWVGVALAARLHGDPAAPVIRLAGAGVLGALCVASMLPSMARLLERDVTGRIIGDRNFDLLQFPRASFFLLSVIGSASVLMFLTSRSVSYRVRKWAKLAVIGWCVLSAIGLGANAWRSPRKISDPWLAAARAEVTARRPQLVAIDPHANEGSLLLAASDVGTFWVSQRKLVMSAKHADRWTAFQRMRSEDAGVRAAACRHMTRDGVDAIVSMPGDEAAVRRFALECGFAQAESDRWLWGRASQVRSRSARDASR